ncbi:MAG: acyl-CoA carboxylase epsilon subunit [Micrococcus sp.]|nr:acyl-CoA carboxylase epsilon subunit [Micrococcus sp.]
MSLSKRQAKQAREIAQGRIEERNEARRVAAEQRDAEDQVSAEQLQVSGATLEPEEMAALTAVLAQMQVAAAEAPEEPAPRPGRSGPGPRGVDRTLDRRQRLGLWARPGRGQWRNAAGPN